MSATLGAGASVIVACGPTVQEAWKATPLLLQSRADELVIHHHVTVYTAEVVDPSRMIPRSVVVLQCEHPAWGFRPIFTAMGAAQKVAAAGQAGAALLLDGKTDISELLPRL
jgi:hypothetical protein